MDHPSMDVLSSLTSKPLTLTLTDDSSSLTSILISPPFPKEGQGRFVQKAQASYLLSPPFPKEGQGWFV